MRPRFAECDPILGPRVGSKTVEAWWCGGQRPSLRGCAQITSGPHRLLVPTDVSNRCLGYASSSRWRPKPAYNTPVETSVYCQPQALGRGCGTALYTALFAVLESEDVHRVVAGVSLPIPLPYRFTKGSGFAASGSSPRWAGGCNFWDVACSSHPSAQRPETKSVG